MKEKEKRYMSDDEWRAFKRKNNKLLCKMGRKYEFDEDGNKLREYVHIDGIPHGVDRVYNPNGSLSSVCRWEGNILHGIYAFYDTNGNKQTMGNFFRGVPYHYEFHFDPKGNIVMAFYHDKDTGECAAVPLSHFRTDAENKRRAKERAKFWAKVDTEIKRIEREIKRIEREIKRGR